jgi:glycosyltransferase involved in cell wall biosynthesis
MSEMSAARRPHNVNPELASLRVILAVKNFAAIPGVCHIGLGVTALNTMKVLRRYGVQVETWSAQSFGELKAQLAKHTNDARPITHVIISSPAWIQPADFGWFSFTYPEIEFVQLNHSGTAYLSIDKYGIRNIRQVIDLELSTHNVRVAFNNPRGTDWSSGAFGYDALLLPNLYDTESFVTPAPPRKDHDPLRVGSFGAGRPWKNQLTAAEAAVQLARRLGVPLELYVNTKRPDGGERMIESRKELFDGLPGCKIVEVPWAPWPKFRDIVAQMDILFSPSFDETFCVVAADGIAEGVPSVTTPALEWTPRNWWCEPWDPSSIVRVAMGLLHDPHPVHDARISLTKFVNNGVNLWLKYLLKDKP